MDIPEYQRFKMPATRQSVTHKAEMGGVEFYITVGLVGGRPMEVFIKAGTLPPEIEDDFGFQGWCDITAELSSVILQAGVPLKVLCRHLRAHRFKPSGFAKQEGIGHANSVPDYLAKWMNMNWGEKDDQEVAGPKLPEPRGE